jgi:hypothetical protein
MQEDRLNSTELDQSVSEISFFWRWIYPLLLCIGWGAFAGIVMSLIAGDSYLSITEKLFSGLLGGAIISFALFLMYETPLKRLSKNSQKSAEMYILRPSKPTGS